MTETPSVGDRSFRQFIEEARTVSEAFKQKLIWSRPEFGEEDYINALSLAEIVCKGAVEWPVTSVSAVVAKDGLQVLAGVIKRGEGISLPGANFAANKIFDQEFDPGPYVAYVVPSEIMSSTETGPELVSVEIATKHPVMFAFRRFVRDSPA